MMPETCWDSLIINIRLVASCLFLSLHPNLTISSASLYTSHNPPASHSHQKVDTLTHTKYILYDLFHIQDAACLLRGTSRNFQPHTNLSLSGRAMTWRLVSVLSAGSASLCCGGQEAQGQVLLGVSVLMLLHATYTVNTNTRLIRRTGRQANLFWKSVSNGQKCTFT